MARTSTVSRSGLTAERSPERNRPDCVEAKNSRSPAGCGPWVGARSGRYHLTAESPVGAHALQARGGGKSVKDQPTILVIDDAAMFRDLASFVLSRSGRVVTASTGEEGLAAARRERPEVAVVDLDLPQMNGDAVCKEIKNDPGLADTAVILVTFRASADDHARAVRAGADDILSKPIDQRQLVISVNRFLRVPILRSIGRTSMQVPVAIHTNGRTLQGTSRDISRSGMFVEIDQALPEGTEVDLEFQLPDTAVAVSPSADVIGSRTADSRGRRGVALRFLRVNRKTADLIMSFVQERSPTQDLDEVPIG